MASESSGGIKNKQGYAYEKNIINFLQHFVHIVISTNWLILEQLEPEIRERLKTRNWSPVQ